MKTFLSVIASFVATGAAMAAVLEVPGTHPTIQAAIQAASQGDTVLVAPGTYLENLSFLGKGITVTSSHGPGITVIDGGQADHVVTFNSGEGPDAVIEGFTITNGAATDGGGIFCPNTSPTIRYNRICHNTVSMSGGGIHCYYSYSVITGNIFHDNWCGWSGGGINTNRSYTHIGGNVFYGNYAGKRGGGVRGTKGTIDVVGNLVFDNESPYGGGLCCSTTQSCVANNVVHGNLATAKGGGVYCAIDIGTFANNTIYKNTADVGGGGLCLGYDTDATVVNTILWDNSAPEGIEIWIGDAALPSTLTISHSDVRGGQAIVHLEGGSTLTWGGGMLNAHPLFADKAGGDLHLLYTSPCRDAGDDPGGVLPGEDFEGDPRTAGAAVDMGADEFHPHLYTTGDAVPGGTVSAKFVGWPGTSPVGLIVGFDLFEPPLPGAYGDWYIKPPFIIIAPLPPIPAEGIESLAGTLPPAPPGPYVVYLQALIGTELTNLSVLQVE